MIITGIGDQDRDRLITARERGKHVTEGIEIEIGTGIEIETEIEIEIEIGIAIEIKGEEIGTETGTETGIDMVEIGMIEIERMTEIETE